MRLSRVAGLLLCFGPLVFLGGCDRVVQVESSPADSPWSNVLKLALVRTPAAKANIEGILREADSEAVETLAKIVLEEWKLPLGDPLLSQARPVWAPAVDVTGQKVKRPVVVIVGDVTPEGGFEKLKVKMASGNKQVDRLCLAAAKKARFRPATEQSRYVTSTAALTFHFHL